MIVKILKPRVGTGSFGGVSYNTNKVDRDSGELMKVANFGPLLALTNLRPQDYINYLQMISAQNKNVKKPQFHAVISAKGKLYDKGSLTEIAVAWLKEMGYGNQPYLIVFHKDTGHNHVHMVTTRINRDGKKIPSDFEYRRAIKNLDKVLGYEYALTYNFSTKAQFQMLLESMGYPGKDLDVQRCINAYKPDKKRIEQLNLIFKQYKNHPDFEQLLKDKFNIELLFHAAEGKQPYGYTIFDHDEKNIFKGSEVLPLKVLLNNAIDNRNQAEFDNPEYQTTLNLKGINIADDVDDEVIHNPRRQRKKKARSNL